MLEYGSCTYIDDLTIKPELLATLCLLRDKIYLPHPYEHDSSCEAIMRLSFENERSLEIERRNYRAWKNGWSELFGAGVLEVLPSPMAVANMPADLENHLCREMGPDCRRLSSSDVLDGSIALAMHALYAKSPAPEFATSDTKRRSTIEMSAGLANVILRRNLAILPAINSEQILELREWTAKYKDGFRLYLASLADDVETRMGGGLRTPDDAADEIYTRKIEPPLEEFFRKELPDKIKWWADVAKAVATGSGHVLKIVAQPWRLENYGKLAAAAGGLVAEAADQAAKRQSNERLAYQFIGRLRKVT